MTHQDNDTNLAKAANFVALEADLLDHCDYADWLGLWVQEGKYVIPVDPEETDFENTLNYAYDGMEMRDMRVRRLTSGESMSASHSAHTLRSVSRFRLLETMQNGDIKLRNAQHLVEYKFEKHRIYAANVEWVIRPEGQGFRIVKKVVRLINGGESLAGMTFLL